jgi:hypothetical protein
LSTPPPLSCQSSYTLPPSTCNLSRSSSTPPPSLHLRAVINPFTQCPLQRTVVHALLSTSTFRQYLLHSCQQHHQCRFVFSTVISPYRRLRLQKRQRSRAFTAAVWAEADTQQNRLYVPYALQLGSNTSVPGDLLSAIGKWVDQASCRLLFTYRFEGTRDENMVAEIRINEMRSRRGIQAKHRSPHVVWMTKLRRRLREVSRWQNLRGGRDAAQMQI